MMPTPSPSPPLIAYGLIVHNDTAIESLLRLLAYLGAVDTVLLVLIASLLLATYRRQLTSRSG